MAKREKSSKKKTAQAFVSSGHPSRERIFERTQAYLMHNIPLLFISKFGISDNSKARRGNVSETTPGLVFYLFSFSLFYAYRCEQFVHSVYRLQNWLRLLKFLGLESLWQGSGRTEWFLNFSPIVGTSIYVICRFFHLELSTEALLLVYFNPLIWLDGLFWLLLFASLKIVFILVLVFSLLYLVAHSQQSAYLWSQLQTSSDFLIFRFCDRDASNGVPVFF